MTTVASDTSVASDRATRFRQRAVVSIASSDISMPTAERLNIYAKRRVIVVGDAMFKAGSLSSVGAETVDGWTLLSFPSDAVEEWLSQQPVREIPLAHLRTHIQREREREIKACWLFLNFRLIRRMLGLIIYKVTYYTKRGKFLKK